MKGRFATALAEQAGPVNVKDLINMIYFVDDYIMTRIDESLAYAYGLKPLRDSTKYFELEKQSASTEKVLKVRKNQWSEERKREFLEDYKSLNLDEMCSRYNLANSLVVYNYVRKFKEGVIV
jgi:hypothetical protein